MSDRPKAKTLAEVLLNVEKAIGAVKGELVNQRWRFAPLTTSMVGELRNILDCLEQFKKLLQPESQEPQEASAQ